MDWLLWAVLIVTAVAAGWVWNEWRHRSGSGRPGRKPTGRKPSGPGRPGGRTGAPPRPRQSTRAGGTGTVTAPAPGEIWWADVPYEDGAGSKVRPCLVLRADRTGAEVLKITSQDKSHRDDHVQIPTRSWDPGAGHDSFLDLSDPIRVGTDAFADRAGDCDPQVWRKVRQLHNLGGRR